MTYLIFTSIYVLQACKPYCKLQNETIGYVFAAFMTSRQAAFRCLSLLCLLYLHFSDFTQRLTYPKKGVCCHRF